MAGAGGFFTVCGDTFSSHRGLSAHRWSKHRIKNSVRQYIGDVSCCPICKVDFHSRARLIKHLSERRVRAKHRLVTCQESLLNSNLLAIPWEVYQELEQRDAQIFAKSRKLGHTNLIAQLPCRSTQPSILKDIKAVSGPCKRHGSLSVTNGGDTGLQKRRCVRTLP